MKSVILIYPKTGLDIPGVWMYLPLSIMSAASLLSENGYRVELLDQRMEPDWEQRLSAALEESPLFVGISSMTGAQIGHGLEVAGYVRGRSGAPIVWGGVHPTLLPEQTAAHPLVDIVVRGDGELTALDLADTLAAGGGPGDDTGGGGPGDDAGRNGPGDDTGGGGPGDCANRGGLDAVPGITFELNGRVTSTPDRPPADLDSLPDLPHGLVDVPAYLRLENAIPYYSSRGCPYKCAFCCNFALSGSSWRARSAGLVVKEIEILYEKYGFDALMIQDENFLTDTARAEEIARGIDGRFRWYVQSRIDDVLRIDFKKLRRWGLDEIQIGIESGSPGILKLIRKGITVGKVIECNRELARTGITATYNFLVGIPTETVEDIHASMNLALQLRRENPNAEIASFYTYAPYPGTELYDVAVNEGFEPPGSLEGWSRISRHHTATPWVVERAGILKTLTTTSKFIDGRRFQRLFPKRRLAGLAMSAMARLYRRRWERHALEETVDTWMLGKLLERRISIG